MSPYDPDTLARLTARHGPDRALAIALGQDAATNADIAAWRLFGRDKPRLGESTRDRNAKIRSLRFNGYEIDNIAERFGLSRNQILGVIGGRA